MPRRVLVQLRLHCFGAKVASGRHRGTIVVMVADTTLTTDAMLAHSVATWDDSRPRIHLHVPPMFNGTVALHQ